MNIDIVADSRSWVPADTSWDTRVSADHRIDALEDLINGGDLSPEAHAKAVGILAELRHAVDDLLRLGATQEEVNAVFAAIDKADALMGADKTAAGDATVADTDAERAGDIYGPGRGGYWTDAIGRGVRSSTGKLEDIISDGPALRDRFESDPKGFATQWRELSSEDRQLAMFTLQQETALDNQITQMLTGLMKSSHDTTMAVARNLQV